MRDYLSIPLLFSGITDRVTSGERNIRSVVSALEIGAGEDEADIFLKDWELLNRLNDLIGKGGLSGKSSPVAADLARITETIANAQSQIEEKLPVLELPFKIPEIELLSVLWPNREASERS